MKKLFSGFMFCLIAFAVFAFQNKVQGQDTDGNASAVGFAFAGYPTFMNQPAANGAVIADPLQRELVRQTVLQVVREDFGLPTRDEALLESLNDCKHQVVIDVESRRNQSVKFEVKLDGKTIYDKSCKIYDGWISGYSGYTNKYYQQICEELNTAFEKNGLKSKPNKKVKSDNTEPLSSEVDELLCQMNHLSQLRALRILHAEIKTKGESQPRLGGIARAYANLSQLTSLQLDSRSYVFAARALIYANRSSVVDENQFNSKWDQIYANTMVGLPAQAIKYRKVIDATSQETEIAKPKLGQLMLDYCDHRFDKIHKVAKSNGLFREIAAVLLQKSAEHTYTSSISAQTGLLAHKYAPECSWILSSAGYKAGVATMHGITFQLPILHERQIEKYLLDWPDLPIRVQELLAAGAYQKLDGRAEIANTLIEMSGADTSEPSLAAVGRGIEAVNCLNIYFRGKFLKHSLAVDPSSFITQAEKAIQNHPAAPLIRTLGLLRQAPKEKYQALVKDFALKDANWYTTSQMIYSIPAEVKFQNMTAREAYQNAVRIFSNLEGLFIYSIINRSADQRLAYADWLKQISPKSPLRFATYMKYDFANHREEVDIWVEENGDHPVILQAAGQAYLDNGEPEIAVELIDRYVTTIPDTRALTRLAGHYYKLNNDEKWIATMNRVFELEDLGLNHASAARSVASTYMHRGDFKAAEPWARRAYQSGSGWGMECLSDCLTGLGEFKEAEQVAKEQSLRYAGDDHWFRWCFENERGNIKDAFALRSKRLTARGGDKPLKDTMKILAYKNPEIICEQLEENLGIRIDAIELINLAVIYDSLGKNEERDKTLKRLKSGKFPVYSNFAKALEDYIETGELSDERLQQLANELPNQSYTFRHALNFYLGIMDLNRDQKDKGIERLKFAARNYKAGSVGRNLAWRKLRELKIDPVHIEDRDFARQFTRD